MARYELRFKTPVAKDLRDVPNTDIRRILEGIASLRDDPRPFGCEKLSAQERYRIRQGNYRILYEIFDFEIIVEIIKVGHRKNVYK
jgi:mRNA interferase RelE/StbE